MYRNHEHYPDPTAGRALGSLRRKENQLNTGKQFEADWKSSMPKDAWCYRLKDSAATYYGGNENLSFSIDNICDFDVYRYPMHHYFELKTIETPSIPLEKILADSTGSGRSTTSSNTSPIWPTQHLSRARLPMWSLTTGAGSTAPLPYLPARYWSTCRPRPAKASRGSGPP